MTPTNLTRSERDAVERTAILAYAVGGAAAVHALASALAWQSYGPCTPCDDERAPLLNHACMICGAMLSEGT